MSRTRRFENIFQGVFKYAWEHISEDKKDKKGKIYVCTTIGYNHSLQETSRRENHFVDRILRDEWVEAEAKAHIRAGCVETFSDNKQEKVVVSDKDREVERLWDIVE